MPGNPLLDINNLSDVSDAATARENLYVDSKEEGQTRVDILSNMLKDSDGTKQIGELGNGPFITKSFYTNQGLSDDETMQELFNSDKTILMDENTILTSQTSFDRLSAVSFRCTNNASITGIQYMPKTLTNPAHIIDGDYMRSVYTRTQDWNETGGTVFSRQSFAREVLVKDISDGNDDTPYKVNHVAGFFGIDSQNSTRQRMWSINTVLNAHGQLTSNDECYGIEIDCNIDLNAIISGAPRYSGIYVAGIGDLSASTNAVAIEIKRNGDGLYKWAQGLRIDESVIGMTIKGSSSYSAFINADAPFHLRPVTQKGQVLLSIGPSSSTLPFTVTDRGKLTTASLYIGKNRVNFDLGAYFFNISPESPLFFDTLAIGAFEDKDISSFITPEISDWTNYNIVVTPISTSDPLPDIIVSSYIASDRTKAYLRVKNTGNTIISNVSFGLNLLITGSSLIN